MTPSPAPRSLGPPCGFVTVAMKNGSLDPVAVLNSHHQIFDMRGAVAGGIGQSQTGVRFKKPSGLRPSPPSYPTPSRLKAQLSFHLERQGHLHIMRTWKVSNLRERRALQSTQLSQIKTNLGALVQWMVQRGTENGAPAGHNSKPKSQALGQIR